VFVRCYGEECDGHDMQHLLRRDEVHRVFWWGNLNERGHSEDISVDGKAILKLILKFVL
jgi:hypothetical protein